MQIGWVIAAYLIIGFIVAFFGCCLGQVNDDDEAGAFLLMLLLFWPVLFIALIIKTITCIPKAIEITFWIISCWFKGD